MGVLPLISKGAESGSSRGRTMRSIDREHCPIVCPGVPDFRKSHGPFSGRLQARSNMTFLVPKVNEYYLAPTKFFAFY